MEDVDLDLDNYDLDDILNLFKVDIRLTEASLKRARNTALLTHPTSPSQPGDIGTRELGINVWGAS